MLWTLFVIFLILWILGLANAFAIGAWIWIFFVIAIISLIAQLTWRRSTAPPRA